MNGPEQPIAGFIDIAIPKPSFRLGLIIVLALGAMFVVVPIALIATSLPNKASAIAFFLVVLFLCTLPIAIYFHRRSQRFLETRRCAVQEGPQGCARFIADYLPKEDGLLLARGAIKELRATQEANVTIRIQWEPLGNIIQPIEYPFGPLRLDESETEFIQLEQAIDPDGEDLHLERPSRLSVEEQSTARRIVRNLRLKGGWIMLAIFGFNATTAIVESVEKAQITHNVLIWVGFFAMYLFISPTSGPFSKKQWLVVPGGLLLRRPSKKEVSRSQLHLFDRRTSVLCVTQSRKNVWSVCVTDEATNEWTIATTKEMRMLLRAWLSPLPPPPADRLEDLQ